MSRLRARGTAAGALLFAVGACMNPPASTVPAQSGCPVSGLAVSAGVVDAAMGLRAVTLVGTNCGVVPRTVQGYPDVGLLAEGRERLSITTTHVASAPAVVTLQPGEHAEATLMWRNTVTAGDAVTGAYLIVVATAGGSAQEVPLMVDLGTTGTVEVCAWRPAVQR